MITEPAYNQPSYSCHQDWINIQVYFKTKSEAEKFVNNFNDKYPLLYITYQILERTVWRDSIIDTGNKYFNLTITFSIGYLHHIIKFNE